MEEGPVAPRGDLKVMIACCAWGNCSRCHGDGDKSKRKWHPIADKLNEEMANRIAGAWRNFDAYVAPMDEAEKQKAATVREWFARNRLRHER
jgi:hypothetical protein